MHWNHVCAVAHAFALAKPWCTYTLFHPSIAMYCHQEQYADFSPTLKLMIVPKLVHPSHPRHQRWQVMLPPTPQRRVLYFPAVGTRETLWLSLEQAWSESMQCA